MIEKTITKPLTATGLKYGVEFFHIYSDEKISLHHTKSIKYLKTVREVWGIEADLILLIDDYNPAEKTLLPETVLKYLDKKDVSPNFWAFEADLAKYAPLVLESITKPHLKKSYEKYIAEHGKFPCSLLTSTWYLIRLGAIDGQDIIKRHMSELEYEPVDRLINILPSGFKPVELKVQKILLNSTHKDYAHKVQDLFYDAKLHRKLALF